MIITFNHGRSSESKLWIDELATCPAGDKSLISDKISVSGIAISSGKHIAFEFSTPRHVSSYGHLGLEYIPNHTSKDVLFEVLFCDKSQHLYPETISYNKSTVYAGLEAYYASAVLEIAKIYIEENAKEFPAGKIRIVSAAHCQVASSIAAFKALTFILLSLLINKKTTEYNNKIKMCAYINELFNKTHKMLGIFTT